MDKKKKRKTFHRVEPGYGTFARRFALSSDVDTTAISADFKEERPEHSPADVGHNEPPTWRRPSRA